MQSKHIYIGVTVGCIVLFIIILMSVLIPSSHKVNQNTVGIYYDKTNGKLVKPAWESGRYFGSPEGELFVFETTQQVIEFSGTTEIHCYTKEGINVDLSVRLQYTIDQNRVYDLLDQFGKLDMEDNKANATNSLHEFISSLARSSLRSVCVKFNATEFSLKRMDVSNQLQTAMEASIKDTEVPIIFNNLQLNNFEYDPTYEKVINTKVNAQSDSIQATAERDSKITVENIALNKALQERKVALATANGEANAIINDATTKANAVISVYAQKAAAYASLMSQLGMNGTTLINTLIRNEYLSMLKNPTVVEP